MVNLLKNIVNNLWFKRILRIKGHLLLWTGISLLSIWLVLVSGLHLIANKPDLLYSLAEWADTKLTIDHFDSQTHPLTASVTLSLDGVKLSWNKGSVEIDHLAGDVNLWNLLMPDLAIGKEMQIQGMRVTLIAEDAQQVQINEQPLASPWLRFWENTQLHEAQVIWQADAPWRLEHIDLSLTKDQLWQANMRGLWHYPGLSAMPIMATATITHQFGFNPHAHFSAELSPNDLPILGQNYQGKLNLTGEWDATAIRANISVEAEEKEEKETEEKTRSQEKQPAKNQVLGEVRSEDLVNWEILIQELQMNSERIALPVWPRININPQQGAKLALHQVGLSAKDRWVQMLPEEMQAIWHTWQPELWFKQLLLTWTPDGHLATIRGGIDILRWQAQEIVPSVDLRDITFDYDPQAGRLQIIPANSSQLHWNWQNHAPIAIQATPFVLTLDPKHPFARWQLPLWQFSIGETTLQLQLKMDKTLTASAKLSAPSFDAILPLLPMNQFSPNLQSWLNKALVHGENISLNAHYQGDISELLTGSWTDEQLSVSGKVDNTTLAFDSHYPALTEADVQISLASSGLHISANKAKLDNIKLNQIKTDLLFIEDHANIDKPLKETEQKIVLRINGDYQSDIGMAKQFLLTTPLAKLIGIEALLKQTQLTGQTQGSLSLWLPLHGYPNHEPSKVLGSAIIQQASWDDGKLQATNVNTKILFSEQRFDIPNLKGEWLQGAVAGRIKQEDKGVRLLLKGNTPVSLPEIAQGEVDWKADIRLLPNEQIELLVTGQQDKLARLLPPPFQQTKGNKNDWKLSLSKKGNAIQTQWQDKDWRAMAKLQHTESAINTQKLYFAPTDRYSPNSTDEVLLILPTLNLTQWLDWLERLPQTESSTGLPITAGHLMIDQLTINQQRYQHIKADWQSTTDQPLSVTFNAKGLVGRWQSHADKSSHLDLSRLRWELPYQTAEDKLAEPLPVCAKPTNKLWSPLTVHIDELDLVTERPEGTQLTPITQFGVEIYQEGNKRYLKDLHLAYKTLKLEGAWMWQKQRDHSNMFIKANAKKAEHFAALFGLENSLDGGALRVESFIDWQGGLDCFDLRTLSATAKLSAKDGALAETSPGLAKLLGLLSFDAFTRRLKTGLSDVTGAGLAYDSILLDAKIEQGKLNLSKMELAGPSVKMSLSGKSDLIGETHQIQAQVTPLIGDSIPTIALLSGASPVAAIGVYLLQKIIPPLNGNILSFDYDITGDWQNPNLTSKDEQTSQSEKNKIFGE